MTRTCIIIPDCCFFTQILFGRGSISIIIVILLNCFACGNTRCCYNWHGDLPCSSFISWASSLYLLGEVEVWCNTYCVVMMMMIGETTYRLPLTTCFLPERFLFLWLLGAAQLSLTKIATRSTCTPGMERFKLHVWDRHNINQFNHTFYNTSNRGN